jgi:hypothetical protein
MKRLPGPADRDELVGEIKTQRVIDSLLNGRALDAFLWKGSANPPVVQRIAAWLLGCFFALAGIVFWGYARKEGSFLFEVFSIGPILLGAKVFRNGFRRARSAHRSD